MVAEGIRLMAQADSFEGLARFYDPIMEHVDYHRWFKVVEQYAALLPKDFKHLDAGCGTGVLLKHLRYLGWESFGVDLSGAMLRQCRAQKLKCPLAVADISALPFCQSFDYITCLFDTVNFLLYEEALRRTMRSFHDSLKEGGILYFDYVTERLVLEHFADQEWYEGNGNFSTTWASTYDANTKIAETRIRINTGADNILYERVYADEVYIDALEAAGFTVLGVMDADTTRKVGKKTCRVDVFAARNPGKAQVKAYKKFTAGL